MIRSHNLHIEVDGQHYITDPEQCFTDLKRTSYSSAHGAFTIRIPNILIDNKLQETADEMVEVLNNLDAWSEKRFKQ